MPSSIVPSVLSALLLVSLCHLRGDAVSLPESRETISSHIMITFITRAERDCYIIPHPHSRRPEKRREEE